MEYLALLPFFIASYYIIAFSPKKAFLYVYIPVILLIPYNLSAPLPGFPDLKFSESALIPIFLYLFVTQIFRWKFSLTDLLVIAFAITCSYSQYIADDSYLMVSTSNKEILDLTNTKFSIFRNYSFSLVMSILIPYFVGKILIYRSQLTLPISKSIVVISLIITVISVYEMRMSYNLFQAFFNKVLQQDIRIWQQFRYGIARLAGPFGHSIHYGLLMGVAITLTYWLSKRKLWKDFPKSTGSMIFRNKFITIAILSLSLLLSFSRGPMIGAVLGVLCIGIGFSKNRFFSITWRLGCFSILLVFLIILFINYADVDPKLIEGPIGSIVYRVNLIEEYMDFMMMKPYWGWGHTTWPKVETYESIDNHYIWLILRHGFVALTLFLAIISWQSLRLVKRGLLTNIGNSLDISLSFTFFSVILVYACTIATVYLGHQHEVLFFLFTGWIEGFLLTKPDETIHFIGVQKKETNEVETHSTKPVYA